LIFCKPSQAVFCIELATRIQWTTFHCT
jgi:hypothetical protein